MEIKKITTTERIKSIDGIRGISYLAIAVFLHYWVFWKEIFLGISLYIYLELFVKVFVAMSGFCLIYNCGKDLFTKEGHVNGALWTMDILL